MGEVGVAIVRWIVKIGPVLGAVTAFLIVIQLAISYMFAGYSSGAFTDIYAMVSMWLPFNLNVIMVWVISTSTAYMAYRMAWVAVSWLNRLVG